MSAHLDLGLKLIPSHLTMACFSFENIIRGQLLAASELSRVTAWGPPVHLDPQVALHVALMLHELGINSVKHGALSRADGSVNLNWSVSDGKLHLQWAERGGPTVKAPLKCGFGTTLIEQTVKAQDSLCFLEVYPGSATSASPMLRSTEVTRVFLCAKPYVVRASRRRLSDSQSPPTGLLIQRTRTKRR